MSEVKKAADLLTDSVFLCLCREWQEKGRCPSPLGDYLRDWGLEECGRVADWAAEYKDRSSWNIPSRMEGPSPRHYDGGYEWFVFSEEVKTRESDDLWGKGPEGNFYCRNLDLVGYATFPKAIATLLDHYRPSENESLAPRWNGVK